MQTWPRVNFEGGTFCGQPALAAGAFFSTLDHLRTGVFNQLPGTVNPFYVLLIATARLEQLLGGVLRYSKMWNFVLHRPFSLAGATVRIDIAGTGRRPGPQYQGLVRFALEVTSGGTPVMTWLQDTQLPMTTDGKAVDGAEVRLEEPGRLSPASMSVQTAEELGSVLPDSPQAFALEDFEALIRKTGAILTRNFSLSPAEAFCFVNGLSLPDSRYLDLRSGVPIWEFALLALGLHAHAGRFGLAQPPMIQSVRFAPASFVAKSSPFEVRPIEFCSQLLVGPVLPVHNCPDIGAVSCELTVTPIGGKHVGSVVASLYVPVFKRSALGGVAAAA